MAKSKAVRDTEYTEDDYIAGSYNVVRRDYYGDPGKVVGAGLTKVEADAYATMRRGECEPCAYEVTAV
jgi:hypothetical protein